MKQLSETITAAGLGIVVLSACCVDSSGDYGYIAGIIGILGSFVAGMGYTVQVFAGKHKSDMLYFPRLEEGVGNAGWTQMETEK